MGLSKNTDKLFNDLSILPDLFLQGSLQKTGFLALKFFFVAGLSGCGSFSNIYNHDSHTARNTANAADQTIISETSTNILVKLVAADSERLMENFGVAEKSIINNGNKILSKSISTVDGSLSLACLSNFSSKSIRNCVFKITKSEGQTVTSIKRDAMKLDHSITIGSTQEAKKLYDSLHLKEWDLGESKLIRFASFDNRFILECTKSAKSASCQIFLSDGRSDSDSSQED